MPGDVLMPKLADTLVEGTVVNWLKAAGDVVQSGEPIAEIETDKVTTELTAPMAGTLSELLVEEGETVPIGTPLVRIRSLSEKEPATGDHAVFDIVNGEVPHISLDQEVQIIAPTLPARRASPLATRIARAHGIDLSTVNVPGGRITREDVERHLKQGSLQVSTSSVSVDGNVVPLKGVRRATAARMTNVRQIPAGCAVVEADVTGIDKVYRQERDAWLAREGFALTYTPFFLYALAQSLQFWPIVRNVLRNGQREPNDSVDVGIAVALEDGLIVPVIRNANQLDFPSLVRTQADLVDRARSHRLHPEEVTGGIATLTNVGSMGGLLALPMLNEHQAVMLGVGAATRRAIGTTDGILYRSIAYLSLTFDRRVLDDLQAERFLLDVSSRVAQAALIVKLVEGRT